MSAQISIQKETQHQIWIERIFKIIFPELWATYQFKLGKYYSENNRLNNIEKAVFCFQNSITIFKKKDKRWVSAQILLSGLFLMKSTIKNKSENIEKAIFAAQSALLIVEREKPSKKWIATQFLLKILYVERVKGKKDNNIEQAFFYHQNLSNLSLDIKNNCPQELIFPPLKIEFKFGKALSSTQKYQEAITVIQECYSKCQVQKNISGLAKTLFELGHAYHQTGKLEQARLHFKDSLRLFHRLQDEDNIAAATIALGNLEIQIGKIPQAQERLQQAKEYYQNKNNPERLKEIDYLLGIIQPITNV